MLVQPPASPRRQPPPLIIAEAPQAPESAVLLPWGRDQEVVLESSESNLHNSFPISHSEIITGKARRLQSLDAGVN